MLTYKATEVLNFAHGDLLMLGAFVGWGLIGPLGLSFWLALPLTVLVVASLAYAINAFLVRRIVGQPQFAGVMLNFALAFMRFGEHGFRRRIAQLQQVCGESWRALALPTEPRDGKACRATSIWTSRVLAVPDRTLGARTARLFLGRLSSSFRLSMNSSMQSLSTRFKQVQAKRQQDTGKDANRKPRANLNLMAAIAAAVMVVACGGGAEPIAGPETNVVGDKKTIMAVPADVSRLTGAWSEPFDMGLVAVHMALQPDGRVLYFGSAAPGRPWDQSAFNDFGVFDWRGATPADRVQLLPNQSGSDIFCSGVGLLPLTGETLIVGGDMPNNLPGVPFNVANQNAVTYNPVSRKMAPAVASDAFRWYPSTATTMSGETLVAGGGGGLGVRGTDGVWRRLAPADAGTADGWYPRHWVAPDGRMFGLNVHGLYFLDTQGTGVLTKAGSLPGAFLDSPSHAVPNAMYRPGFILTLASSRVGAAIVDISRGDPKVTETEPGTMQRTWGVATVLADGRVLATGGSPFGTDVLANAAYSADVWNPVTGEWIVGPRHQTARLYHGSALLLPDARVLLAGGGLPGPVYGHTGEIYSPSYLYTAAGALAPRPEITAAPTVAEPGSVVAVRTRAAGISRVTLVRAGAITHSANVEQRFIDLPFSADAAGTNLSVRLPSRASDTPPGFYMVFVFDAAGVPSVASMLRINLPGVRDTQQPPAMADLPDLTSAPGAVRLQPQASSPRGTALTYSAAGLPPGVTIDPRTGALFGDAKTPGSYHVSVAADDGSFTGSRNFVWTITRDANAVASMTSSAPSAAVIGRALTFTATATGTGVRYAWDFGDGTPSTDFSTNPSASHTYSQPGVYTVRVTTIGTDAFTRSSTILQAIGRPVVGAGVSSSQLAVTGNGATARVWMVNPDSDTVAVFNGATRQRIAEIAVGQQPGTVTVARDGRVWVSNRRGSSLSVIDPGAMAVVRTVALPAGSQPHGVVADRSSNAVYVALEAAGRVLRLDSASFATTGQLDAGPTPRHLALDRTGARLFVSLFITPALPGESTLKVDVSTGDGQVVVVDTASMTSARTVVLGHSAVPDAENQGSGIPNYLGAMAISPDGTQAFVPSKQDNVLKGGARGTTPYWWVNNLNHQNTVRAVSSRIDLATLAADTAWRIDHDNASRASAAAFSPNGAFLFVALETGRQVAVLDAHRRVQLLRLDTELAPQALAVSADGSQLYVANFMGRSLGVYDLAPLVRGLVPDQRSAAATVPSTSREQLPANVLRGKQLFYDARDPRLAAESYMSCASCHDDGGHDGRTWDFTQLGEGLRNTPTLRGRAGMGQGPLHRSGNFDEVQDFEGQIRALSGGRGLLTDAQFAEGTRSQPLGTAKAGLSADLDALTAYLNSLAQLDANPARAPGTPLTAQALAGRDVFAGSCAQCHGGAAGASTAAGGLMNVGTLTPASGQRLGQPLTGLVVPTLRGLWATAPYLHDGSAPTIEAAVSRHVTGLSAQEVANVAAFVRQADLATEVPDTVLSGPGRVTLSGTAAETVPGRFDITPADHHHQGGVWVRQRWSTTQAWQTSFDVSLQRRAGDGMQADGMFFLLQAGAGGKGGDVSTQLRTWDYNRFGVGFDDRPPPPAGLPLGQARSITGKVTVSWDPASRRLSQFADLVIDGVPRQLRDEAEVDLVARLGPTAGVGLWTFTGGGVSAQSASNWRVRFGPGLQAPAVQVMGSASAEPGGGFVLTPVAGDQAGAVWRQEALPTGQPFETRFRFRMTNPWGNVQADGLAFVLQPNGPRALSGAGGCIGMCGLPGRVAAVFRTWEYNSAGFEFDARGSPALGGALVGASRVVQGTMTVRWDPGAKRLSMRADFTADGKPRVAEDAVTIDLAARFGATVTAGVTAGTGGGVAGHSISDWTLDTGSSAALTLARPVGTAALLTDGGLRLTSTAINQVGAAWSSQAWPTDRSFVAEADVSMVALGPWTQADGLAFVLHAGGPNALGGAGGCIGCDLPKAIRAALLTWTVNGGGLIMEGKGALPLGFDLGMARVVTGRVQLRYDAAARRLHFAANLWADGRPVSVRDSVAVDLAARFGPTMTAGFTGATGAAVAEQGVRNWTVRFGTP